MFVTPANGPPRYDLICLYFDECAARDRERGAYAHPAAGNVEDTCLKDRARDQPQHFDRRDLVRLQPTLYTLLHFKSIGGGRETLRGKLHNNPPVAGARIEVMSTSHIVSLAITAEPNEPKSKAKRKAATVGAK